MTLKDEVHFPQGQMLGLVALLSPLGEGERDAIMGGTARRVYLTRRGRTG